MREWKKYILSCIWGPLLVVQIILVFVFGIVNKARLDGVVHVGLVIWAISVFFGWMPIFFLEGKDVTRYGTLYK